METLRTADGLTLHLQRWPAAGAARGTVQVVHGLGEHIGRYAALAQTLNAVGWHVAGHDQRGHGRSEGPRGSIPHNDTLPSDLALVTARLRGPGAHVVLGHSMGGLVAALAVQQITVDGLVLSSPAFDPGLNAGQHCLLRVLGTLAPGLPVDNGLDPAWISRDADVVRRYRDDPLVHSRVTPRLVRFIVEGGQRVLRSAAQWRTPTLLLWAGADRCVAPAGSAAFAAAAPRDVVTAVPFPGLFHEIFNEPEQVQVTTHLTRWLQRF